MPNLVLVDNDVLLKISTYNAAAELFVVFAQKEHQVGALSVAQYVVEDLIRRRNRVTNKQNALEALALLSSVISWLEPTTDEVALAATYEEEAQKKSLSLDTGESLLLAMLILRMASLLLTGDKRAIYAIEQLSNLIGGHIAHRVACLEQLILSVLAQVDFEKFRTQICAEIAVDKTMSICFACLSNELKLDAALAALASYVGDLRKLAPNTLVASDDLSAITA